MSVLPRAPRGAGSGNNSGGTQGHNRSSSVFLGPVVPPTPENLRKNIAAGYTMIIPGNDMRHFRKALKELVADSVEPVRNEH